MKKITIISILLILVFLEKSKAQDSTLVREYKFGVLSGEKRTF